MSVAIYAIFRNERDRVAQWAETTAEADYRYVLDTGSDDDTTAQLELHGIDYDVANFAPFRFDDARNAALAMVPIEIEWCLQLDADETLSWDWRQRFEAVVDPSIPRYRYRWENHGASSSGVVMRANLHSRRGFRWRYPCHEILAPHRVPTLDVPLMTVEHHPDENKSRGIYLELLARGADEQPDDHRMAYYYGRELYYVNRWTAARAELWRFLNLPGGWAPERSEAYRLLAVMDDSPERWLLRAATEAPERREPWCDLARLYLREGSLEAAEAMCRIAETRTDETVYTTSRDCWGEAFTKLCSACSVSV